MMKDKNKKQYVDFLTKSNSYLIDVMPKLYRNDLNEFKNINDYLKNSERYVLDYAFNIIVDTHDILYYILKGEYEKYNEELLDGILERIDNLESADEIIGNILILGNAYSSIDILEKAIYCYTKATSMGVKNNNQHHIAHANHNIGYLYDTHQKKDKAITYTLEAHEIEHKFAVENDEFTFFWFFNLCSLATLYYETGAITNARKYYLLCLKYAPKKFLDYKIDVFAEVSMYYEYHNGNIGNLESIYQTVQEELTKKENFPYLLTQTTKYYTLVSRIKKDSDSLIKTIKEALDICKGKARYNDETELLKVVIQYHLSRNEQEIAKKYIKSLCDKIENHEKTNEEQKKKMMELKYERQKFLNSTQEEYSRKKNLEILNEKLEEKNKYANQLYQRLHLIQTIGLNIIASVNLDTIAYVLYQNLNNIDTINGKIDAFALINMDEHQGTTEYFYNFNSNYNTKIKLSNDVINTLCKQNQIIRINDIEANEEYVKLIEQLKADPSTYRSALIAPVVFNEKTIGFSIFLSKTTDAYTTNIANEFISQLTIFVAIAVNNIQKEQELSVLLEQHIETKEELNIVNTSLQESSQLDFLTKVNNRRSFDEYYKTLTKFAYDKNKTINVYMVDIDHFKQFNDTFGHLKGDDVLVQVAQALSTHFTEENQVFARYGGEEFIGLTIGFTEEEARQKAELIRKEVEKLNIQQAGGKNSRVSISVGITTVNKPNPSDKSYIAIADSALYQAKEDGRNCVRNR